MRMVACSSWELSVWPSYGLRWLDQLELNGHVDRLRQQFFDAVFAQQLTELHQGGGVARLAILVVALPREKLPAWCVRPALDHTFVGLIEGVLQVQQRNHHPQRYTRATGLAGQGLALRLLAKEIQIGHRSEEHTSELQSRPHLVCR